MAEGAGVIRARRAALAAWLALMATGCAGWRVETAPPAEVVRNPDVHAVRIIKLDKSKVELYDPSLQGDTIVGHPTERAIAKVVMPISQVQTIATRHTSFGKTILAVLAIGGGIAAYAALQSLNQGY
jgi:PBP1b-binding outer membrane lipoprotein LpoB